MNKKEASIAQANLTSGGKTILIFAIVGITTLILSESLFFYALAMSLINHFS